MNNISANSCGTSLCFSLATIFLLSSPYQWSLASTTTEKLDRALINSLARQDLKSARVLLEKGENPDAFFGKTVKDSTVCTALDNKSSKPIELLVEYGASTNAFWTEGHVTLRTPLACAIFLKNFEAFHYLLSNGADPSVDLYPEGREKFKFRESAFVNAMGYKTYPMALEILKFHDPSPQEIKYATGYLERSPYTKSHPWNYAREEIIEWIKERDSGFEPCPTTVDENQVKSKCTFSDQDRKQGLMKGTICQLR